MNQTKKSEPKCSRIDESDHEQERGKTRMRRTKSETHDLNPRGQREVRASLPTYQDLNYIDVHEFICGPLQQMTRERRNENAKEVKSIGASPFLIYRA